MKRIIIISLCLISLHSVAQRPDTTYFDINGRALLAESTAEASYYELNYSKNRNGVVNTFYLDHSPRGYFNYLNNKRHGHYITHYPSGAIKESGMYNSNDLSGDITRNYQNGQIRSIQMYFNEGDSTIARLISAWDSTGVQQVKDGSGWFNSFDFNNPIIYTEGEYNNGVKVGVWEATIQGAPHYREEYDSKGYLTQGLSIDDNGDTHFYTTHREHPTYSDGETGWFKFLRKNLKYPKTAKRRNVQGEVLVLFLIDKNGNVKSPEIIKGIGFGCDEEAIRVIKESKKWIPAKERGLFIESSAVMRILYRLR